MDNIGISRRSFMRRCFAGVVGLSLSVVPSSEGGRTNLKQIETVTHNELYVNSRKVAVVTETKAHGSVSVYSLERVPLADGSRILGLNDCPYKINRESV